MTSKHKKNSTPFLVIRSTPAFLWADIESLLLAAGAMKEEGRGSRVRFALNGVFAVFHRPHPEPTTNKGAVKSVRRFLESAGIREG